MNKEFVTYEQALALKELGFDEPCLASYETAFGKGIDFELGYIIDGPKNYVLAPLYQQAFRWFREKYNIDCYIDKNSVGTYYCKIRYDNMQIFDECHNATYEEAELACLNKLIEICRLSK
jgi:hypothetical protein